MTMPARPNPWLEYLKRVFASIVVPSARSARISAASRKPRRSSHWPLSAPSRTSPALCDSSWAIVVPVALGPCFRRGDEWEFDRHRKTLPACRWLRHRLAEAYPVGRHAVDDGVAAHHDLLPIADLRRETARRGAGRRRETGEPAEPACARPGLDRSGEASPDAAPAMRG